MQTYYLFIRPTMFSLKVIFYQCNLIIYKIDSGLVSFNFKYDLRAIHPFFQSCHSIIDDIFSDQKKYFAEILGRELVAIIAAKIIWAGNLLMIVC